MSTTPFAEGPKDPSNASYWEDRYANNQLGWDIGYPSTPLKEYIDQLVDKDIKILIPGAGNAYEATYLWKQGFRQVFVLDIAKSPLEKISNRVPDFPKDQLINSDFFQHEGVYDLILEQTFFCSFYPSEENRSNYVKKMLELLKPNGKLVGLLFNMDSNPNRNRPPYMGDENSYRRYFAEGFKLNVLATAYNSIPERAGNELFFIAQKEAH